MEEKTIDRLLTLAVFLLVFGAIAIGIYSFLICGTGQPLGHCTPSYP